MNKEEAGTLVTWIDSNWKIGLDFDPTARTLWMDFFARQTDVELTTKAVLRLIERQRERPTLADIRNMIAKLETDQRMSTPAIPEAEFVRNLPGWVKVWLISRAVGDRHALPEQRPGYNSLLEEHPHSRTYVWADQIQMAPEARAGYEKQVEKLGGHLHKIFEEVFA